MKLRDIMKLSELSGFRLIAGEGGLNREVNACEIVDFEFADGIEFSREEMFYGNSIGLTSLMFARYDPSMILGAVKQLDSMGVACLSYKPVFFKDLPQEVLDYSEANDFPIYEITDDAFFEDIVLAVKKAAGLDMTEREVEDALEKVITDCITEGERGRLEHMVLPAGGAYLEAVCIKEEKRAEAPARHFDRDHIVRYARRLSLDPRYSDRVNIVRFRQGGLIFMTINEESGSSMDIMLKDAAVSAGIPLKGTVIGMSGITAREDLPEAVKEAYWAMQTALIDGSKVRKYPETGIYGLLAPQMSSGTLVKSAKKFLGPLLKPGDEDLRILLLTAKEYVISGYDLNEAADKLFCHRNTVRYRLRRIHSMTGEFLDENDFRECLALSVRVLLLEGTLRNI